MTKPRQKPIFPDRKFKPWDYLVMLRKAGDAPGHKPVVVVCACDFVSVFVFVVVIAVLVVVVVV
ncbi:MAG: hypothetical protein OIF54_05795, partial [Cohaesibacter sp.]|nr:hypothetical protein [Cohaesibacter sp.]